MARSPKRCGVYAVMTKAEAVQAIVAECLAQGVTQPEQIAYVLATAEHETGGTMMPVREAGYLRNPMAYLRKLRYYPYYGRGHVQLTWKVNYHKYEKLLGLPLVANPDLVLRFDVSAFILVHGMRTGAFTGKKLSDYFHGSQINYYSARRIVNGIDRAAHIANLARRWLSSVRLRIEDIEAGEITA